jgi:hypothetical protein
MTQPYEQALGKHECKDFQMPTNNRFTSWFTIHEQDSPSD